MSEVQDELKPLPAEKLCNKNKPNPIKGYGPLGNEKIGHMYYVGNDKKEVVITLQKMLKTLGYDIGTSGPDKDGVDGDFRDTTEKAVVDFQGKNKDWDGEPLNEEGLVGPRSSDSLNRAMVGKWYEHYQTPKELVEGKSYYTVTSEFLANGLAIEPGKAKNARVFLFAFSFDPKTSDPNSLIPISDLIDYVVEVEKEYSSDNPQQILTRIRQTYYNNRKFVNLIEDAPWRDSNGLERIITHSTYYESATYKNAIDHLTSHADENDIQDNPSPYIVRQDERVDFGHVLLGLDALLHPKAGIPYTTFGIPNIDPASWVADLAIAVQWTDYHEISGSPSSDAPSKCLRNGKLLFYTKNLSPPFLVQYYDMSAPNGDLFGDIDSFGMLEQWNKVQGQKLSEVLRAYYLGSGGNPPLVNRRFRIFCKSKDPFDGLEMFPFTLSGLTISWDATNKVRWIKRINRMADLCDAGILGSIFAVIGSIKSPPRVKSWNHSSDVLDLFLNFLESRLLGEIRITP